MARATRRRLLTALGTSAAALGGCTATSTDLRYESGTVEGADGDPRTAEEMASAEALAQQQVDESATPLDSLELRDHEFVVEDGYRGPTVQGAVANDGEDAVTSVEVRVRVYGENGAHLGRYLDSTGDLDAGRTRQFEVILLTPVGDIAGYDVAVLGVP